MEGLAKDRHEGGVSLLKKFEEAKKIEQSERELADAARRRKKMWRWGAPARHLKRTRSQR